MVLAALDRGDHIICQVTSRPYHEPSIQLAPGDFVEGGLPRESYARPDQIFTANEDIVERKAGRLGNPTVSAIQDTLRDLLLD